MKAEERLSSGQRKKQMAFKGGTIEVTASLERVEAKKTCEWDLHCVEEKTFPSRNLYPIKMTSRSKVKRKTFLGE